MKEIALIAAFALISLVGTYFAVSLAVKNLQVEVPNLGSVEQTHEYNARQFTSSNTGTTSLKAYPSSLGSVVVTAASGLPTTNTPVMAFYDTSSSTRATTTMTAFVTIGSSASTVPTGTYVFDAVASSGIQVWVNPGFTGNYTITTR